MTNANINYFRYNVVLLVKIQNYYISEMYLKKDGTKKKKKKVGVFL